MDRSNALENKARQMKTYLTESEGWAQADIEAVDLEQAEEELRYRIANLEIPYGTKIVGELEENDDIVEKVG